jgi:prepilin-type N-terminal cleavage/methylation domain-containing protein
MGTDEYQESLPQSCSQVFRPAEDSGQHPLHPNSSAKIGFTLVELLVVIAMTGILAGLLLPVLSKAKSSARLAKCSSNLRQIGLASAMYVGEFGAYPTYMELPGNPTTGDDYALVLEFWTDKLVPYLSANWTNDIYQCPGNPLKTIWERNFSTGVFENGVNYDINANGVGWNNPYGLGAQVWTTFNGRGGLRWVGCKESQVVSPSQMIAYGDAVPAVLWLTLNLGTSAYFGILQRPWDGPRARQAITKRHEGLWNINHADGHVETFKTNVLFGKEKYDPADEEMRRRWNRDHAPHWEELSRPAPLPIPGGP